MDLFEEEELMDETRAKLVQYKDESVQLPVCKKDHVRVNEMKESEDEYYAGKPVSRSQLSSPESEANSDSDMEYEHQEKEWNSDEKLESDAEYETLESHEMTGSHDEASGSHDNDGKSFAVPDVSADIAKGKAAKQQLEMWESLLEVRIHLQKMLTISNRLPPHDVQPAFVEHGKQPTSEAIEHAEHQLEELMDKLMTLQKSLLLANPESEHVVTSTSTPHKQQHKEQPLSDSLSELHHSLRSYCNEVITKWQDRTQLASGRVSSNRDFIKTNQSIVTQIDHLMQDTPRLVKRSQLKRSQYKILGKPQPQGSCDVSHDAHLRDCDEEIFDDGDFYHQLLQAFINNKMNLTDSNDPVSMGRQLLELQKLRRRAKKVVDTKASKGRKIRDGDVHSKLVNFMTPVYQSAGSMSDVTKNELFSSLFR